jgi:hypothetical protein
MKHAITSSKSSTNSSKPRRVKASTLVKPNGLYETRGVHIHLNPSVFYIKAMQNFYHLVLHLLKYLHSTLTSFTLVKLALSYPFYE